MTDKDGAAEVGTNGTEPASPLDLFERSFDGEEGASDSGDGEQAEAKIGEESGGGQGDGSGGASGADEGQEEVRLPAAVEGGDNDPAGRVDKKVKPITAIVGEDKIEYPGDAKFANDEGEEFTLKEAVNSFATNRRIDQRFTEVDKAEKSLAKTKLEVVTAQRELAKIDRNMKAIMAQAQKGDIMGVTQTILKMAGGNNQQTMRQLLELSEKQALELSEMTDEEREALFARTDLELERQELEDSKKQHETKITETELGRHVDRLKVDHEMTDDELSAAYEALKEQKHQFPESPIEIADTCANWVLAGRELSKISDGIRAVDTTRASDASLQQDIIDVLDATYVKAGVDYTHTEIEEIARELIGTVDEPASQNSSTEPAAAPQAAAASPEKAAVETVATEKKEEDTEPLTDYEQLIEKYADQ